MKQKSNKENTSALFNRYVWLVETIQRAGKITYEEINSKWTRSRLNYSGDDMPLRTFHNHRYAIEELFDINIECDKHCGYVYYIENEDDMQRGGMRSWMLNAFSVGNLLNDSSEMKERILFEKIPSGHKYLTLFLESIRENLTVEITYQSFESDEAHTFKIEPYCLKVFRQRWYVLARNPYFGDMRIYSLDRLHHVEITKSVFNYPSDFSPEAFFADSFGIITEQGVEPESVIIKVMGKQRKYLETLPLHHSQTLIKENEEYATFQYRIHPTYDFILELFSHGENIEIIKPEWLREEFIGYVKGLLNIYEKLDDVL